MEVVLMEDVPGSTLKDCIIIVFFKGLVEGFEIDICGESNSVSLYLLLFVAYFYQLLESSFVLL